MDWDNDLDALKWGWRLENNFITQLVSSTFWICRR